jgi:hypothetical protein
VQAKIIVENATGTALQAPACGSLFAVALGNDTSPPAVAWATCLQILTVPVGESSYAVPLIASYPSCGTGSPDGPCTDGHPAPLPPGRYQAHLYQSANIILAPAPISVRVTR